MDTSQDSVSSANPPKCGIASESDVAQDVIDALSEEEFVNIKRDFWKHWCDRKDIFDCVVMRDIEFIIGFIKQVDYAQERTLAALFIHRPDKVDKVLKRIEYNDKDLFDLISYRPKIRESRDGLLKLVEMIENPEYQKEILEGGITRLFDIKKHASVIPLIHGLVSRTFKNEDVKNIAIQKAFERGTYWCIREIVEEFYDHPAITPREYATAFVNAWDCEDSGVVFPFILSRADKGDLEAVQYEYYYMDGVRRFCRLVYSASIGAAPAGTRHSHFFERVKQAIITLQYAMNAKVCNGELIDIIESHLVYGQEWVKEMKLKQTNVVSNESEQEMSEQEEEWSGTENEEVEE